MRQSRSAETQIAREGSGHVDRRIFLHQQHRSSGAGRGAAGHCWGKKAFRSILEMGQPFQTYAEQHRVYLHGFRS